MELGALLGTVRAARVYDLEQPRHSGIPTLPAQAPGFVYALYRRHEAGSNEVRTTASGVLLTTEHVGTHIDALCHQAEALTLFGGRRVDARIQTSTGFTELGAETIRPILARGVLLDAAGHAGVDRLPPEAIITRADLEEIAEAENVTISEGDVLLVRTGYGGLWDQPESYLRAAGVSSDGSRWAAEHKVLAVGADNTSWEVMGSVDPDLRVSLGGHLILLVRNGIYILEHLFLEELARDRSYQFLFVCLPLKLRGATGSPVRPLAVLPDPSGLPV